MPDMNRWDPIVNKRLKPDLDVAVAIPGIYKYRLRTDSSGYRIPGNDTPCDGPVIVVLGDSFALGIGVEEEESFAGLIRLRLAGRACLVNASVPGSGLTQQLALYEMEIRDLKPAAVILATFTNDLHDCRRVGLYKLDAEGEAVYAGDDPEYRRFALEDKARSEDHEPRRTGIDGFLLNCSRLYMLLTSGPQPDPAHIHPRPLEAWEFIDSPEGAKIFKACFTRLCELTLEDGASLFVITIPHHEELALKQNWIGELIESETGECSFVLVDPEAEMEESQAAGNIWFREGHFDERGHQAVFRAFEAAVPRFFSNPEIRIPGS